MNSDIYFFEAAIQEDSQRKEFYVNLPADVQAAFGKGNVTVHATIDGASWDGDLALMGTRSHTLTIHGDICAKLHRQPGDMVRVVLRKRKSSAKRVSSVEEYIAGFPAEQQEILHQIRQVIREAAPEAEERTSWAMPTYWQRENLVHFAGATRHVGFYPSPAAILHFADRLAAYKTSKGTVQFPYNQPVPYDLIGEITRWRVKQVEGKE